MANSSKESDGQQRVLCLHVPERKLGKIQSNLERKSTNTREQLTDVWRMTSVWERLKVAFWIKNWSPGQDEITRILTRHMGWLAKKSILALLNWFSKTGKEDTSEPNERKAKKWDPLAAANKLASDIALTNKLRAYLTQYLWLTLKK